MKKKADNIFEKIKIIQNPVVIYKNNNRELFEGIYLTDKKIYTGYILNNEIFVEGGFIPKHNVKQIISGIRRTIQKKKS